MSKTFTITKKVAKHGSQAVIVIPSFLQQELGKAMLMTIRIFFLWLRTLHISSQLK